MEDWMKSPLADPEKRPESIRAWYERTTKKVRRALLWATAFAVTGGAILWCFANFATLARIQTFQGAFSIPTIGGIWILSFIYMFLVPSREVSFRSQESIEQTVELLRQAINEKIGPAATVWERIGKRVESELPSLLEEIRDGFSTAKAVTKKLERVSEKNEKLAEDAKPTIEALRKISDRFQREIDTGLLDEARSAFESVRNLAGVPKNSTEPDLEKTLVALRRKKT